MLCKLLRARPFSFPSSLTKEPSKARRRRLDICRRLGGPAWSLKRSSDLSALIDGHKPPGWTSRVGKEVPPRKVAFHMLILGYKYSRGAAEQQRACWERERPTAQVPPSRPVLLAPRAGRLDYNDRCSHRRRHPQAHQHQGGEEGRSPPHCCNSSPTCGCQHRAHER